MIITILAVYLILAPLTIFVHEMGHALGILLFTKKGTALFYIGSPNNKKCLMFKFGRIQFHFRWAMYGFCFLSDINGERIKISDKQSLAIDGGGPILSLITGVVTFLSVYILQPEFINPSFLIAFGILNIASFISTAIPRKYSKRNLQMKGIPTDGYRIKQTLNRMKNNTENRVSAQDQPKI